MFAASMTADDRLAPRFAGRRTAGRNRLVLINPLGRQIEGAEADNDHVDVGLAPGLALPGKRPVGK